VAGQSSLNQLGIHCTRADEEELSEERIFPPVLCVRPYLDRQPAAPFLAHTPLKLYGICTY
jgi:hypothetical protein